ncbi:hypothetical protein EFM09_01810 [Latilactobacillus curvatus]|uniref:hypothetical protein n=2 Tax=Latilactobacillus curvatus TaxID=28038 RepID=UPI000976CA55|nr:hypothetical protein [Latilactobacillus curvatus]MCT1215313.1 hypothetical protein [Latilactobacillus curvatus]MDG2982449.1 hypothetical protein [Latilactobacillus curvatus]
MDNGIGFQSIFTVVKKYWWVIALTFVIGAGAGLMTAKTNVSYESMAKIYVDKGFREDKNGNGLNDNDNDRFWQSINAITKTDKFKQQMLKQVKQFNPEQLSIDSNNGTNIIAVKYSGSDITDNVKVVNQATKQIKTDFLKLSTKNTQMTTIDHASKKTSQKIIFSNKKTNMLMGAIYGIIIGFVISALHFILARKK